MRAPCASVPQPDHAGTLMRMSSRAVLAHISDTHVGYRAYRAVAPSGRNQREEDFLDAFRRACADIVARDVPLVVHSGDLADNPNISYRLVKELRDIVRSVASVRPDGSRRQFVIVAGNHDLPGAKQETCFLELLEDLDGVHVYTSGYRTLDLACVPDASAELRDIVIHAVPHDDLADVDHATVVPYEGRRNILVTHGTAGGTDLYRRCVGREYAIPTEVLERGWAYGALGHWHLQGPVDVGGSFARVVPGTRSNIWYAGSTENSGFGDLADGGDERGYLLVALDGGDAIVEPVNLPIRPMIRCDIIDAADLDPEELTDRLIDQLDQLDRSRGMSGAVVSQRVSGCDRTLWSLVDVPRIRARAARTLHHDLKLLATRTAPAERVADSPDGHFGDLDEEIVRAADIIDERRRPDSIDRARHHLAVRLNRDASVDLSPDGTPGGENGTEEDVEDGDAGDAGLPQAGAERDAGATLQI